jgi:hypothetical protein
MEKNKNLVEKKSQLQNPRNTLEYLLLEFSLYSSTNIINPLCHELIMMYKLYSMFVILMNISLHSNTKIINQSFHETQTLLIPWIDFNSHVIFNVHANESPKVEWHNWGSHKMMNKGEAQSQF